MVGKEERGREQERQAAFDAAVEIAPWITEEIGFPCAETSVVSSCSSAVDKQLVEDCGRKRKKKPPASPDRTGDYGGSSQLCVKGTSSCCESVETSIAHVCPAKQIDQSCDHAYVTKPVAINNVNGDAEVAFDSGWKFAPSCRPPPCNKSMQGYGTAKKIALMLSGADKDEQHPCHGLYVGSSWAASTHAHATCEADPSLLRSRPSSHAKACGSTRQNLSSTRHCKAIKSAAEAKARSAAEDLSAAGAATALLIIEPGIPRPQIEGDQRHSPILFNPDSKDSPRKEYRSVGWQKTISQPHLRGKLGIGTLLSEYIPTASRIHNAEQQLGQWGRRGIPAAEKDRWSFLSPRAMKQKSIPDACEQSLTVCATAVKGADPHGLDGGVGKSTKNIYIARAPGTHIAQFPEGQRQGLDAENEDFETTTSQNTTDSNKVSADIDTGNEAPRARVVVETPRSPSSCHTPRTTRVTSKRAGDIGGVASAQSIGEGRPQSNAIESFRDQLISENMYFSLGGGDGRECRRAFETTHQYRPASAGILYFREHLSGRNGRNSVDPMSPPLHRPSSRQHGNCTYWGGRDGNHGDARREQQHGMHSRDAFMKAEEGEERRSPVCINGVGDDREAPYATTVTESTYAIAAACGSRTFHRGMPDAEDIGETSVIRHVAGINQGPDQHEGRGGSKRGAEKARTVANHRHHQEKNDPGEVSSETVAGAGQRMNSNALPLNKVAVHRAAQQKQEPANSAAGEAIMTPGLSLRVEGVGGGSRGVTSTHHERLRPFTAATTSPIDLQNVGAPHGRSSPSPIPPLLLPRGGSLTVSHGRPSSSPPAMMSPLGATATNIATVAATTPTGGVPFLSTSCGVTGYKLPTPKFEKVIPDSTRCMRKHHSPSISRPGTAAGCPCYFKDRQYPHKRRIRSADRGGGRAKQKRDYSGSRHGCSDAIRAGTASSLSERSRARDLPDRVHPFSAAAMPFETYGKAFKKGMASTPANAKQRGTSIDLSRVPSADDQMQNSPGSSPYKSWTMYGEWSETCCTFDQSHGSIAEQSASITKCLKTEQGWNGTDCACATCRKMGGGDGCDISGVGGSHAEGGGDARLKGDERSPTRPSIPRVDFRRLQAPSSPETGRRCHNEGCRDEMTGIIQLTPTSGGRYRGEGGNREEEGDTTINLMPPARQETAASTPFIRYLMGNGYGRRGRRVCTTGAIPATLKGMRYLPEGHQSKVPCRNSCGRATNHAERRNEAFPRAILCTV